MPDKRDDIPSQPASRQDKIKAHAEESARAGEQQQAADREQLRAQRPLEYGVLLTAVGGLAVRFADEGFQFLEDYALRLRNAQAIFSATDKTNEHITISFQWVSGGQLPASAATEVLLDLEVSEGALFWNVSGLSTDPGLFTSFEVASDILLKLTDISERFDKRVSNG